MKKDSDYFRKCEICKILKPRYRLIEAGQGKFCKKHSVSKIKESIGRRPVQKVKVIKKKENRR